MELDQAVIVIGPPKHGKTTIGRELVKAHLEKYPTGIALVHDTNRQFTDLCRWTGSVAACRANVTAARREKKPIARGWAFGGESTPVSELAAELGQLHNRADDVRVPILLVYDETSMMESSGSTHIAQIDLRINANRRHWGIAPVYNLQRPTALTEAFYTMSTDVYVFAQPSERRTRVLEEYLGLADGRLARLVGAGKYTHAHWRQGEGLV